jgi:tape measure domain-containing protein
LHNTQRQQSLQGLMVSKTRKSFLEVSQAATVMGLSSEETSGLFLALRQSLSGGTVQLEEINQISERIPGAMDAAAQALGVATGQVKGLISARAM